MKKLIQHTASSLVCFLLPFKPEKTLPVRIVCIENGEIVNE
jgi:hypothetical protein